MARALVRARRAPFGFARQPFQLKPMLSFLIKLKSLDWRARKAEQFDRAPEEVILEVTARILALVNETVAGG